MALDASDCDALAALNGDARAVLGDPLAAIVGVREEPVRSVLLAVLRKERLRVVVAGVEVLKHQPVAGFGGDTDLEAADRSVAERDILALDGDADALQRLGCTEAADEHRAAEIDLDAGGVCGGLNVHDAVPIGVVDREGVKDQRATRGDLDVVLANMDGRRDGVRAVSHDRAGKSGEEGASRIEVHRGSK